MIANFIKENKNFFPHFFIHSIKPPLQKPNAAAQKINSYIHIPNNCFSLFLGSTNPRILIIGKTVVSNCYSLPEGASNSYSGPKENAHGLTIDTLANKEKTIFYKFHSNEMYPEYVLVYRDVSGPKGEMEEECPEM